MVDQRNDNRKRQMGLWGGQSLNANIPVLGDAEQIVGLTPVVEGGTEHATIPKELCGSIDTPAVKNLIKELPVGGQEAFQLRGEKYGF